MYGAAYALGRYHPVLKATIAWLVDFLLLGLFFHSPHLPWPSSAANSAVVTGGQGRGNGLRYLSGEEKK